MVSFDAENEIGVGLPGSSDLFSSAGGMSTTNSNQQMLGTIQIHQIEGISSTSIRVSWRLTEPKEDIKNVDGFYILYR